MYKKYIISRTKREELGRFAIRLDTVEQDGKYYPYSYIETQNSVAILAEYKEKFIFIRQYRHSIGEYILEIPGGSIEKTENPEEAAKRELLEETGYIVEQIKSLGFFYPTAGSSNEKCFLYYAICKEYMQPKLEPLEFIENELVDLKKCDNLIKKGEMVQSMGLIAWLKYKTLINGEKHVD